MFNRFQVWSESEGRNSEWEGCQYFYGFNQCRVWPPSFQVTEHRAKGSMVSAPFARGLDIYISLWFDPNQSWLVIWSSVTMVVYTSSLVPFLRAVNYRWYLSTTGCTLNIVFFLKIFWTLPILLQRRCSTCLVCVHTLTPRENRVRNIY